MMKPILTAAAAVVIAALAAGPAGAQTPGVSLVIKDGRVTLKAEQASVRQILAEWERQGQVRIVGAEKLTGAPITIALTDVPERQALDIVMRGVQGYMAVDRTPTATMAANTSRFDRLIVMARATTPVAATPMAGARPSPALAPQPSFMPTAEMNGQPAPDDDTAPAPMQPERNDVEQFTNVEPPMPEAPVASPYPNAYPGSPYIGAQQQQQQSNLGPYGGNPTAAAAAAGTMGAQPELQFDYANPQKYFEQRRLQQEAAGNQPTATPTAGGLNGGRGAPTPSATPTAPGTLARPGIAPTPAATPQTTPGEFFNPYNLPADWVPPPPVTTADPNTPPVEPDRSKYANPYEQPKPPEE
jgi:hypothetical protein